MLGKRSFIFLGLCLVGFLIALQADYNVGSSIKIIGWIMEIIICLNIVIILTSLIKLIIREIRGPNKVH